MEGGKGGLVAVDSLRTWRMPLNAAVGELLQRVNKNMRESATEAVGWDLGLGLGVGRMV